MLLRTFTIVLAATALAACRPGAADEADSSLVDDSGRHVNAALPVNRIVSLSPAATEILFELGVGERVVGRTRWCDAPPEALQVPSVGDGLEPNVEVILARRPDLIVFYSAVANEPAIEQIEALGINTLSIRTDRLSDLARATRLLGRVTGTEARADSIVAAFESELGAFAAVRRPGPRPQVLILTWDNPPIIIGEASFLNELVQLAGARNVFDDVNRPSLRVSIEAIVERDPDLVLVTSDSSLRNRVDTPEWLAVPAIREGRFFMVSGNEYSRPSFRVPSAIRKLSAALEEWR